MLIDHAIIHVRSGKGGEGHISFARFKYVPKGGPDGGNGGDGGNVFLFADPDVDTLLDFTGRHDWHGHDGGNGQAKQAAGRDGEDLRIPVPLGTLVYDQDTGETLADLDAPGKEILVAKGGRGGFGNEHYKTPTLQAPRVATPGEPAQERNLRLELKLIADVGIIGKPNAGKSTLLSRVSRATPKIAAYPFTTLSPILGITELVGARRMVLADIPGLIEGAHQGHGLGTQFLRHIERTRLLLHLLEVEPADGSDPIANYHIIRHELASYSPALAEKPELLLLTKMDLLDPAAARQAASRIAESLGKSLLPISAATGLGVPAALEACWKLLHQPQPA